jgi:RNA polymerase sigma-70 factor (ECF subfamily)
MVESPTTSLTLLGRLGAGSADGWDRMVRLYEPLIRAWLRSRGLQTADIDDLTQAALAVIFRRIPDFEHNGRPGAFRTWLRVIVGNALRDHIRTRGRKPGGDDRLLADLEDLASELNARWDADHDRHVLRGLMRLVEPEFAPATWRAFVRTSLDGLAPAEAAAELGLSVNAVHVARSRVLARLRREAGEFLDGF